MLLVKKRVGPSKIAGIGLFADEFIPKGAETWRWNPQFDIAFSKEELAQLSKPAYEAFIKYCYFSRRLQKYILCFDDARFLNHSETPNLLDVVAEGTVESVDVAARDIHPGEELTCNYRAFDPIMENLMGVEMRAP